MRGIGTAIRASMTVICLFAVSCGSKPTAPGRSAASAYRPSETVLELNNEAVKAMLAGNPRQALKWLDSAIQKEPGFYQAYANKLWALTLLGRYEEAVSTLRALNAMQPGCIEAIIPSGVLFEHIGEPVKARSMYELALMQFRQMAIDKPDDPAYATNEAIAMFLLDTKVAAAKRIAAVLAEHPEDSLANSVKAKIEADDRNAFIKIPENASAALAEPPAQTTK